MENQTGIRYKLAYFFLRQKQKKSKRLKSTQTLNNSKSALILFNASKNIDTKSINKFAQWLTDANINVSFLAYANEKSPISETILTDTEVLFNSKDCNWLYQVKKAEVLELLQKDFDLLFDFTSEYYFPLHFCATLSNSKFKAGAFKPGIDHLDFMIDLSTDKSIKELSNQLMQYFGQLKG